MEELVVKLVENEDEFEGAIAVRFDEIDAVFCEQLRGIAFFHRNPVVVPPVVASPAVDMCLMVAISRSQAAKLVKSLIWREPGWDIAEVPLSKTAGSVTVLLQQFGDRHGFVRETSIAVRFARKRGIELAAESLLILPREHGDSCRRAHRSCRVEVRKANA